MVKIRYEFKEPHKKNVEKESKIAIKCIVMPKRCLVLLISISSTNRFKSILPITSNKTVYDYVQDYIRLKLEAIKSLKKAIKINVDFKLRDKNN